MQRTEETVFVEALEMLPAERSVYLDVACQDDPELRKNVESLLRAYAQGEFLESPAAGLDATVDNRITEESGSQIGPYKLLQKIGEGGMGVVYKAEQREPVLRRVALKIIKPGMDTKQVIARFDAERRALALMEHPNIAKVLDAGTTESGHPFFVMELVNGIPLTEYCDERELSVHERLGLFASICRAVQHAHQKGIIHRDLKPSNILVAEHDHEAVPVIIDFGIAKATGQRLTEKTLFTEFGQVVGTLEYASPEQARRSQLDIDTRSDVYSLGVVLYELLTSETPFDRGRLRSAAYDEMLQIIREEEPPPPSTKLSTMEAKASIASKRKSEPAALRSMVHGELDWMAMKALEKDPNRRYESAAAMANDVNRFLNNEPLEAGPPTISYRVSKAWRRNRVAFSTAGATAAALLAGLAIAVGMLSQLRTALAGEREAVQVANEQREQAVSEAQNSQRLLALVLEVLSKNGADPETGREYPVSEALDRLVQRVNADGFDLQPGTDAELHLGLARALLKSGQRKRAKKHFDRAWKVGQQVWPDDDKRLADVRREAPHAFDSIEGLQLALAEDRKSDDVLALAKSLTLLGSVAFEKGKLDLAKATLREALQKFPQSGADLRFVELPHLILADVLKTMGETSQAEKLRSRGVEVAKQQFWDWDQPWYRLALSLSKSQRLHAAARAFEMAKTCDRTVSAFWVKQLGHHLLKAGDFQLANHAYTRGVSIANEAGDLEEAIWNTLNQARIRLHACDYDGADELYKKAISLSGEETRDSRYAHNHALFEYGNFLFGAARGQEAARQYDLVVAYLRDHPNLHRDPRERLTYLYSSLVMTGHAPALREELESYLASESVKQDHKDFVRACMIVNDHKAEIAVDPTNAFQATISNIDGMSLRMFRDKYVEWMASKSQLESATRFLAEMNRKMDIKLPASNPERAWTRQSLADVLLRQEVEPERAKRLLEEAIQILKRHPFVPEEQMDSLRSMILKAEALRDE